MARRVCVWVCVVVLGASCTSVSSESAPAPTLPVTTATIAPAPTQSAYKGPVVVEAAEQYFYPEVVTISRGTTVLWKDVQGTHDMVAEDRSFASAVLFEGGTYSFTFSTSGHYRYVCTLHVGAGMWAEVDVE